MSFTDTNVNGGVSTGSVTVMECLNDCYHNTSCTAVDWNPSSDVGGRCWLHVGSVGSRNTRSGVQHFAVTKRCGRWWRV